jgi:tRNA-specific 2-thiouridylase
VKVLVAMSGGVDSSVAAARLVERGHDVTGATLKLWGGDSDSGCCSVADVDDARRVAQQLGVAHHVFNLTEEFEEAVVGPYVAAHAAGRTPNPCIECNRHIKFDLLLARSHRLGYDALATGHHARVGAPAPGGPGRWQLRRGVDVAKDQSYVLSMLGQRHLARLVLPVGEMTKAAVRAEAARLGLRTADKPDSQDVCFITSAEGRAGFLRTRLTLHPGRVVDADGTELGPVDDVELVTVGQRKGLGAPGDPRRRYVVGVDVEHRTVRVADAAHHLVTEVALDPASVTWVDRAPWGDLACLAQVSAHGVPADAVVARGADRVAVVFAAAQRPVAPGQTVAFYDPADPDAVLGAAIAA